MKTNQVKTGQYNKYVSIFTFYTAKLTKPRPVFISGTYQYLNLSWARLRDVSGGERRKPQTTCAVWTRHRWRNGPNHKVKHMAHSLLRYTVSPGLEPINFVFPGQWTYSTVRSLLILYSLGSEHGDLCQWLVPTSRWTCFIILQGL